MDMLSKQKFLRKAMKALADKSPDGRSSSDKEEKCRGKKAKRSSSSSGSNKTPSAFSGSTKAKCFLCGVRGHRSSECRFPRDKWVSLDAVPGELHNSAKVVRGMIKKAHCEI